MKPVDLALQNLASSRAIRRSEILPYQLTGYREGQPVLRQPGGKEFSGARLNTNGAIAAGIAPTRSDGSILLIDGMPYSANKTRQKTKKYDSLDIYILQDISGSFAGTWPIVAGLFDNIEDQLNTLRQASRISQVRVGLGLFGDFYEHKIECTKNYDRIRLVYEELTGGGGDEPQLDSILQSSKNPAVGFGVRSLKIIVMITDEPDEYSVATPEEVKNALKIAKTEVILLIGETNESRNFWQPVASILGAEYEQINGSGADLFGAIARTVKRIRRRV